MRRVSFIIVAPSYNERVGGVLVLHKLCDLINGLGHTAYIWRINRWPFLRAARGSGLVVSLLQIFKNLIRATRGKSKFLLNPALNTPLAKTQNLHGNVITIYPEIIDANPTNDCAMINGMINTPKNTARKATKTCADHPE